MKVRSIVVNNIANYRNRRLNRFNKSLSSKINVCTKKDSAIVKNQVDACTKNDSAIVKNQGDACTKKDSAIVKNQVDASIKKIVLKIK